MIIRWTVRICSHAFTVLPLLHILLLLCPPHDPSLKHWFVNSFGTIISLVFLRQDGMTVLMQAAINGHAAIIKLLLRAGADKEAEDEVNLTCTLVALIAHKDVFFKRKAIYKWDHFVRDECIFRSHDLNHCRMAERVSCTLRLKEIMTS